MKRQKLGAKRRKPITTHKNDVQNSTVGQSSRPAIGGVIRPRRNRPGTVALREIRRYQKTTGLLLPRKPFIRLIREVLQDIYPSNAILWQKNALLAIQEAAEAYLVDIFPRG